MSFGRLLSASATVFERRQTSTDPDGNAVVSDVDLGRWPALLTPTGGQELLGGRETVVADFLLVVGPNDLGVLPDLAASSSVSVDGVAYEVAGPPLVVGRRGVDHHIEAPVRVITG